MKTELPFRQIHLDFHTHEAIPGIGADFDPDIFADTLAQARVNSINLFARCHHGWIYYYSAKYADRQHPHLTRDLLREQIDACHARGIKTPVYITVQWDHYTALRHPEWRVLRADGSLEGTPPYEAGFYRRLCLNTPYVDWLKGFVQDVIETLPVDGLWLDIVDAQDCSCAYCQAGMRAQELEPSNEAHRVQYGKQVLQRFQNEMTAFIHALNPDLLIFYNAGHVGPRHRAMLDAFTHLELESLPSGGWGYLHFPIAARYGRTLGLDYLGMTGKFQTSWGDFHSFKNQAALEFECNHMLALNAKCCVGDQLLPHGRICAETYKLVGAVYAQVEQKEAWCTDAAQVPEIGVLTPEAFETVLHRSQSNFKPIQGAVRMLQEGVDGIKYQFDILDGESDFSRYKVLVLPDYIPVDAALQRKLDVYLAQDGAIVASFASGMDAQQTQFTLDMGVALTGEGPHDAHGTLVRGKEYPSNAYIEYIVPRAGFDAGLAQTEYAMYMRGMEIAAGDAAEVLADTVASQFDRTYDHFCSHRQTPSAGQIVHPAVVQQGRAIYFSQPIFSLYQTKAPRWCKQLLFNALARLLPEPLVRVHAPTASIITLNAQPQHHRQVLHLLYYVPERRCDEYDVIEDVTPLYDVAASIKAVQPVKSVSLIPQNVALPFTVEAGQVTFTVPKIEGHQMVEITL
ncbi:MAG TPA: beta-galactosidase trimerization domain-containing protein [Anaerolineae bacterium]|nr:beta-galactosidase trimerization domain-containing protein [Anaerolineae bacterium]HQI82962.1 beta-galactosidase trimerization domain-containing protein [Anaerolineae bacterium]